MFMDKHLPVWYPPAETKVPVGAIATSLFPCSDDFEGQLRRLIGADACVTANSGRSLLSTLLHTLWKKSDYKRNEALIPGYTCYSVAASVVRAGLKIRVYDFEPYTLNPAIDSVIKNINENTCVIVGQHLLGIPTVMEELKITAQKYGIYFIEDAAQALGGKWKNEYLGMLGDFGLYSFGRGKPLPLGEGGALVGKYDVLKEFKTTRKSSSHIHILKSIAAQIFSHPYFYGFIESLPLGLGETVFDPQFPVAPMPDCMKRLGVKALSFLSTLNIHRNVIAQIFIDFIDKSHTITLKDDMVPVFSRFPIIAGTRRISQKLLRLGVRRMYPKAIQDVELIKPYLADRHIQTPSAAHIAESLITLPTHHGITEDQAMEIVREVKEYYSC
jgi:dTDP-4-amino-4,6-dideoxygalactose transaminase